MEEQLTLCTIAFTPILLPWLVYATDKSHIGDSSNNFSRVSNSKLSAYRTVVRVAKPFSTGSGVPVASP
jgi:hypothetical protein